MSVPQTLTLDRVLTQVHTGMTVYDVNRREIGIVSSVYLSGIRQLEAEVETQPVIPTIAGMFVEDRRLPELLIVRLGRTGFCKVTPTLEQTRASYYITPQQILTIQPKLVYLKVPYDMVIRH